VGGVFGGADGFAGTGQLGQGGGAFVAGGTTVHALNTLFGLNQAASAPDFSGNFTTASHNFLEDGTGSNLPPANPDADGNIVGSSSQPIDPLLGPLTRNGGPTQTMALLAGSPCLDAGTATGAPTTGQRGVARGSPPDIGAFESASKTRAAAPAPPRLSGGSDTLDSSGDLGDVTGDLALRLASLVHEGLGDGGR
jgi:hypothetical protein